VIAGLIVLNPLGLNVMAAAFEQSATDWFRQFWTWIAAAGAVAVLVFGWVEYYIRGRMLSRRLGAGP
jgi:hypothetical protein